MAEIPDAGARVFISYSRVDRDIAESLRDRLQESGFDAYLDIHDIAPGEDWRARLAALVASAEKVVFLISPDSVASEFCDWEVNEAERQGKSVLPVVIRETGATAIPSRLERLNFIFHRDAGERGESLPKLISALSMDLAWEREKTRVNDLAMRWEKAERPRRLLTWRDDDIRAVEAWRDARPPNAPAPTEVQLAYISESRRAFSRRQRWMRAGLAAVAIVTTGLAAAAFLSQQETERQRIETDRERRAALLTESRFLNDAARRALQRHDAFAATALARKALPERVDVSSEELDRPLLKSALETLYDAYAENRVIKAFQASPAGLAGGGGVALPGDRLLTWGLRDIAGSNAFPTPSSDAAELRVAKVWSSSGALLARLGGHSSPIRYAFLRKDGRIETWSGREIRVWEADLSLASTLRLVDGSADAFGATTHAQRADRVLLSRGSDPGGDHLGIWKKDGRLVADLASASPSQGARPLDDDRFIVFVEKDGRSDLEIWSWEGRRVGRIENIQDHGTLVWSLPKGRIVVFAQDGPLTLHAADGSLLKRFGGPEARFGYARKISPVDAAASAAGDFLTFRSVGAGQEVAGVVAVWSPDKDSPVATFPEALEIPERVDAMGAEDVLIGLNANRAVLWRLDDGAVHWLQPGAYTPAPESFRIASNAASSYGIEHAEIFRGFLGRRWMPLSDTEFLYWGERETADKWTLGGELIDTLEGHQSRILGALRLEDGVVTWDEGGSIRLWPRLGGELDPDRFVPVLSGGGAPGAFGRVVFNAHAARVREVHLVADGIYFSIDDAGRAYLWSAEPLSQATASEATPVSDQLVGDHCAEAGPGDFCVNVLYPRFQRGRTPSNQKRSDLLGTGSFSLPPSVYSQGDLEEGAVPLQGGARFVWKNGAARLFGADGRDVASFGDVAGAVGLADGRFITWPGASDETDECLLFPEEHEASEVSVALWSAEGRRLRDMFSAPCQIRRVAMLRSGRIVVWHDEAKASIVDVDTGDVLASADDVETVIATELPEGKTMLHGAGVFGPDGELITPWRYGGAYALPLSSDRALLLQDQQIPPVPPQIVDREGRTLVELRAAAGAIGAALLAEDRFATWTLSGPPRFWPRSDQALLEAVGSAEERLKTLSIADRCAVFLEPEETCALLGEVRSEVDVLTALVEGGRQRRSRAWLEHAMTLAASDAEREAISETLESIP